MSPSRLLTRARVCASSPARQSGRRRACALLIGFAAVVVCSQGVTANAEAALPPQGVYEQCGPATDGEQKCLDRLDQIRQAGFTAVLNYAQWFATVRQLK